MSQKDRSRFVKGPVPHVELKACKVNNKKMTFITGLELWQIDLDEFCSYTQHKCACSVSKADLEVNVKNPKYAIQVQGAQIKAMEEILGGRYKVPKKYMSS